MVLLILNVMSTGSVYGTQLLGKYLQKLVVFVIFIVSSSIVVVIIPPELLKWLRHVTFMII
uniref:Transmembrane protein n=1 Tax=Medicago truncatula TaxID=3880 RepID=I3SD04_MEDTR|nr:unknown [Medicago truncatula]